MRNKYHQPSRVLCRGVGMLSLGLALAVCAPAGAQETDADVQGGLAEIVVTAQHREENLQEVPISISAVTAAALESGGVNATDALTQMVPAVQFTRTGQSGLFFLRGVGTTNGAAGEEGANSFYIDGVYLSDLGQTITSFNNIARIEVLKGPQGTLFGRNATGGLVHVITRDPGDELVIKGQVGYGNYETVTGQFYAGGPITDRISWDIALAGQNQGKGWGRNLMRNAENKQDDHWGVRSKAVFRPAETVKLTLSGDYYEIKDNIGVGWRLDETGLGSGGAIPPRGHDTTSNDPAMSHLENWGVSLTAEIDLDFATLTSVSAMRNSRNHTYFDVDGGPSPLIQFDFTSNAGQDLDAKMITASYAAFGELTYAITPTTHLTGGIRYTEDRRTLSGTITPIPMTGAAGAPVIYPRAGIDLFGPAAENFQFQRGNAYAAAGRRGRMTSTFTPPSTGGSRQARSASRTSLTLRRGPSTSWPMSSASSRSCSTAGSA